MTSSPAPDLDELERLATDRNWTTADDLRVMVRKTDFAALLQEVRAARAAVAESGRLREALREAAESVVDWADHHEPFDPAGAFEALRKATGRRWPLESEPVGPRYYALLATPSAPSVHGALDVERLRRVLMDRELVVLDTRDFGGMRMSDTDAAAAIAAEYAAATSPTEEAGL